MIENSRIAFVVGAARKYVRCLALLRAKTRARSDWPGGAEELARWGRCAGAEIGRRGPRGVALVAIDMGEITHV